VIVLIPGIGSTVYGARRWINFGFFSFQPTELAKIAVILYLSSWFLYKERKRFLHFILILGSIIGLTMLQPDLGTSLIIFSLFISIYFISGENLKYLYAFFPVALVGILGLILTSPYRLKRLMSFLDPSADPEGSSYHIRQILISLSSGGIFGRGFSNSRQKYQFLPEAHTDSIFAIIGEEVGFIGGFLLISLYIFLLYSIYRVALKSKDRFGFLLSGAILTLLSLQAIINLGGMVAIMPLTGVPLPFISYGGSSLLIFYSLMGIVISVARN
jgi:cell division protein FtsW